MHVYLSYFGEAVYHRLFWRFLFKAETSVAPVFPQTAQTRDPFTPVTYQFFVVTEDFTHPFSRRQIGIQIKIRVG